MTRDAEKRSEDFNNVSQKLINQSYVTSYVTKAIVKANILKLVILDPLIQKILKFFTPHRKISVGYLYLQFPPKNVIC